MAHKSQVWVADDEDAYARAHILNEKDNGTTVVQIEGRMGDTTLPTSECYKVNPENQDGGTLGTQSIVGGGGEEAVGQSRAPSAQSFLRKN